MKKSNIKLGMVLLALAVCMVGTALFWSSRNFAAALKRDPARITGMDIVVFYSGEMGEEPGPITFSDALNGEDFAQLVAHTSFWRLSRADGPDQYPAGLPHCILRIACGEQKYSGWLSPDGKQLSINGETILVSGDLQERILALDLGPEPSYQWVLSSSSGYIESGAHMRSALAFS